MEFIEVACNLCGGRETTKVARGPDFEYQCSPDEFTIVQCVSCGLVYLNPRPSPSELPIIYPVSYIPYRFEEHLAGVVNQIRMFVQGLKARSLRRWVPANAQVWDVGCGGGEFLVCLRKYGGPEWKLTGVDISEEAAAKTGEKGFCALQGRFETMDIQQNSVDAIVMNQVIEHLDDPAAVLRKAAQIIRPGGVLFIETPSLEGWDARIFKKRHWGGWHFPRHWTFFTAPTLSLMMKESGFRVVDRKWLLSPNFWAQSFNHWLVDRGVSEKAAGCMDCKNPLAMVLFSGVDMIQRLFGHTSNMRVIGIKE